MRPFIRSVRIASFVLPLQREISVQNERLFERRGWIIALIDQLGNVHFGEVAPLVGVHRETIGQCYSELNDLRTQLTGCEIRIEQFNWERTMLGMVEPGKGLSPAVQFGIEQALLSVALRYIPNLARANVSVPCAGLINLNVSSDVERAASRVDEYVRRGARSVKVKVGGLPIARAVAGVRRLAAQSSGAIRFRLDANRGLSMGAFRELRDGLAGIDVEFFEEPVADPSQCEREAAAGGFCIALDEHLWDLDQTEQTAAGYYVLKPSRLGGISGTVRWINLAKKRGVHAILSSCYDSGLSMLTYAFLCSCFDLGSRDMGLGTYESLQEDVLRTPLGIAPGVNEVALPSIDLEINDRTVSWGA